MREITYKVYLFDELPKESQQKAIEKWRQDDDLPFLHEDMEYKLTELLQENKIKTTDHKVYYSLSYCQGDGAMFEMQGTWNYYGKKYYLMIKHYGHYNHKYERIIEMQEVDGTMANEKAEKKFTAIYENICDELKKYGYDCIEYQQSDECITETLKANDYEFTLNGSIA